MIEETPTQYWNYPLESIEKRISKFQYELTVVGDDWYLHAKHRRPKLYPAFIFIFLGILRLIRHQPVAGLLIMASGVIYFFIYHHLVGRYELLNSGIKTLQISKDKLTAKMRGDEIIDYNRENIQSIDVALDYVGKKVLASVLLKDRQDVIHVLAAFLSKKELEVNVLAQDVRKAIVQTVGLSE